MDGFGVSPRWSFARFRIAVAACGLLSLLSSGCNGGHKPVYPVHGQVHVDGRAPANALVTFHPVGDENNAVLPTGSVDQTGRLTLTSYASGDGAPEGEYRVTVVWFLYSGRPGDDSPPANYLPGRYGVPGTTPLHAVVRKGGGDLELFELQSR